MTDMELAEEIERHLAPDAIYWHWEPSMADMEQIIAALRRVPSDDPMSSGYIPLCAGHAETWFTGRDHLKDGMKATCVVCAFERPPSGEMVMVPREPTEDMRIAGIAAMAREQNGVREIYRAMLSACEEKK